MITLEAAGRYCFWTVSGGLAVIDENQTALNIHWSSK